MRRLGHVPALDGIRGIAIAAVVLYHFFGLTGGFMGVDLFFVLSGFLITTLLLEDGRLGRFYQRRVRRLLPALIVVLLVCIPIGWTVLAKGGFYLSNGFRAFSSPDPLVRTPVDHLWSLAEEEQFYLVWPLLLLAFGRHRRRLTIALAVLFLALVFYRVGLAASGASFRRVYFGPDTHADGLVLGSLIALVPIRLPAVAGRIGLGVVAFLLLVGALSVWWIAAMLPVFELAAAAVVLAAVDGQLPVLSSRLFVWLGLISYSLYLWQQPVRWYFGWTHPLPALGVTVIAAVCSYRFVEKPFRRRRQAASLLGPVDTQATAGT